jgi:hypothetical protein
MSDTDDKLRERLDAIDAKLDQLTNAHRSEHVSPMDRMRRGFAELGDPSQVRRERRGMKDGDNGDE